MIDKNKYAQYGFKRDLSDIKGICIHNTNNYKTSAQSLFKWLNSDYKGDSGCHYLIDHEDVIEVMPLDYGVYHTGKGYDYGNKYTVAIEICSNLNNELYLKGQDKAIKLIKQLMEQYNITTDELYFHNDFNIYTYCPANILDMYGNKKNFIEEFFGGK